MSYAGPCLSDTNRCVSLGPSTTMKQTRFSVTKVATTNQTRGNTRACHVVQLPAGSGVSAGQLTSAVNRCRKPAAINNDPQHRPLLHQTRPVARGHCRRLAAVCQYAHVYVLFMCVCVTRACVELLKDVIQALGTDGIQQVTTSMERRNN